MSILKLYDESFTTSENCNIRDKYIDRIDVLDKVKALSMLPDNKHLTAKMIAEYYEVDKNVIEQIIKKQRNEFISDGMLMLKGKEAVDFNTENNSVLVIPRKMINVFTRRSVLRIGMLLRDSVIAKEVRNYLLSIEENTTNEQKKIVIGGWTDEDVLTLNKIFNQERKSGNSKMESIRIAAKALKKNPQTVYQKYRNVTKKHGSLDNYIAINNLVYFNEKSQEIHQTEMDNPKEENNTEFNQIHLEINRFLENMNTVKELELKVSQLRLETREIKHKLELKELELEAKIVEISKKDRTISKLKKSKIALESNIKAIRKIVLSGVNNTGEIATIEEESLGRTYTKDKNGLVELK
ncbi:hypothetical protein ACYCSU_16690 [Paenibacillus sp. ALE1]